MAKKHENYLYNLISSKADVYTGSELVEKICENFPDCSAQNARKIIQNAVIKNVINSSKPTTFGHNQFAYYAVGSNLTYEKINNILSRNRPGLKRVIDLLYKKRAISILDIYKLAATPVTETTTKVTTLNQVINFIVDMGLATSTFYNNNRYLVLKSIMPEDEHTSMALEAMEKRNREMRLDALFLPIFVHWLKKHHMITNEHIRYRSKSHPHISVEFNGIAWDAVMHTKSTGFYDFNVDNSIEKYTCVVVDIKISSKYTKDDLMGFYDRIQIFRNSVKQNSKRKILPIILCNDFEFRIKTEIRNLNIICFDVGTLFGERIYDIIQGLMEIDLSNRFPELNIYKILDILKILEESGQKDNLGNIKGELFERMFYPIFQKILKPLTMNYGYIYKNIEYDYIVETEDEYIIIELKGYKGKTYIRKGKFDPETNKPEVNTIKWFLNHTFPSVKEKYKINPQDKPVKCCYITSGMFDKSALKVLEEQNKGRLKPNQIDLYYDGSKLIDLLRKHNLNSEVKAIIQYYEPVLNEDLDTSSQNQINYYSNDYLDEEDNGLNKIKIRTVGGYQEIDIEESEESPWDEFDIEF